MGGGREALAPAGAQGCQKKKEQEHSPGDGQGGVKIGSGNALHLLDQIGGYTLFQRKHPKDKAGEGGGKKTVEKLTANVSSGIEAAFSQKREDLAVDGDPRPAQKKGGHGDPACKGTLPCKRCHTGG